MELVEEITSHQKELGTCCVCSTPGSRQGVIPGGGTSMVPLHPVLVYHCSIALICRTGTVFRLGMCRNVCPSENSSCILCSSGMLNTADKASNTRAVSCSPLTSFSHKAEGAQRQPQGCNTKKLEPREEPGHGDGWPSLAGIQACSQTFPTSSPLCIPHSSPDTWEPRGSSWSSLSCTAAVSRAREDLRIWRGANKGL